MTRYLSETEISASLKHVTIWINANIFKDECEVMLLLSGSVHDSAYIILSSVSYCQQKHPQLWKDPSWINSAETMVKILS